MRVICIDDSDQSEHGILKEGETYTVVNQKTMLNILWYELSEHPGFGYRSKRFIPLSEIDETEFERDYKKELV